MATAAKPRNMMPAQKSFDLLTFMEAWPRWCGIARSGSVLLDVDFGDHALPLVELRLHEIRTVLRAGAARLHAHFGERRLYLVLLQHLADLAVELRQHVGRNAGGYEHAEPQIDLKALQPGLVDRGYVRIDVAAREASGSNRAHAVVAGERQRAGDAAERELHLAAHHIGERGADAAIGNMGRIDAGALLEHLGGEMRGRADAGGGEI